MINIAPDYRHPARSMTSGRDKDTEESREFEMAMPAVTRAPPPPYEVLVHPATAFAAQQAVGLFLEPIEVLEEDEDYSRAPGF